MEAGGAERDFLAGEGAAGGFLALPGLASGASLPRLAGFCLGGEAGALEPSDREDLASSMSGPNHDSLVASPAPLDDEWRIFTSSVFTAAATSERSLTLVPLGRAASDIRC